MSPVLINRESIDERDISERWVIMIKLNGKILEVLCMVYHYNENWIVVLNRNENNFINNPDFKAEDICKKCAKNIYNCLRMMTECNWKPDFHEATESGDFLNDEQCYLKLEEINEEWNNK